MQQEWENPSPQEPSPLLLGQWEKRKRPCHAVLGELICFEQGRFSPPQDSGRGGWCQIFIYKKNDVGWKSWSAQFWQGIELKPRHDKGQRKALSSEDSNILARMRMFSNLEVCSVLQCVTGQLCQGEMAPEDCLEDGSRAASQLGSSSFHQQEDALGTCWFSKFSLNVGTSGSKNCWRQVLISIFFLGFSPPLTPFFFFFSFLRGKEDSCPNELI